MEILLLIIVLWFVTSGGGSNNTTTEKKDTFILAPIEQIDRTENHKANKLTNDNVRNIISMYKEARSMAKNDKEKAIIDNEISIIEEHYANITGYKV